MEPILRPTTRDRLFAVSVTTGGPACSVTTVTPITPDEVDRRRTALEQAVGAWTPSTLPAAFDRVADRHGDRLVALLGLESGLRHRDKRGIGGGRGGGGGVRRPRRHGRRVGWVGRIDARICDRRGCLRG